MLKLFDADARISARGLQQMEDTAGDSELAAVTVFGRPRVGKSWLCSLIATLPNGFPSAPGMESMTLGANARIVPLEDIGTALRMNTSVPPCGAKCDQVLVVDLEGKGHQDEAHDARLLLPFFVASRTLIYVVNQGGTARDSLLEELRICVRLAESVTAATEAASGSTSGATADPGESPVPAFGSLFIVVNGVTGDLDASRCTLNRWLEPERVVGVTGDAKEAARRRNDTREALTTAFADVTFVPLPPPTDRAADASELSFDSLTKEYRDTAIGFFKSLRATLATPRILPGSNRTLAHGTELVSALKRASKAASDDELVVLPDLVALIDKTATTRIRTTFLERATTELDAAVAHTSAQLKTQHDPAATVSHAKASHAKTELELTKSFAQALTTARISSTDAFAAASKSFAAEIAKLSSSQFATLEERAKVLMAERRAAEADARAKAAERQAAVTPQRTSYGGGGGGGGYSSFGYDFSSTASRSLFSSGRSGNSSGISYKGGAYRDSGGRFVSRAAVERAGYTWKRG